MAAHRLQTEWEDAASEFDYVRAITDLIQQARFDDADAQLRGDLADIDTPIANLARTLSADDITLCGWDDMNAAVRQHEGDPLTAIHLVMSNMTDIVFTDKTSLHDPVVEVAFYTDQNLAFSTLTREQLLAESASPAPAWYGQSEDIEVYFEITGLAALNTALLRHKNQFLLRPGADEPPLADVPIDYIEYSLCAMLRALWFHRLVKMQLDASGVAGNVPVIVGMDNMRPTIGSVCTAAITLADSTPEIATLTVTVRPRDEVIVQDITGSSIRRRLAAAVVDDIAPDTNAGPSRGFFQRLLVWR